MTHGIIMFSLRKRSGIHRKGFQMFPEMFGYENTLFEPRGKAHEALGRCKRSFVKAREAEARDPGVWGQTLRTLTSGPGVREGLLPCVPTRL